ncbi:MAG: coproporphyrinogen III oxidase, partial [Anaerovoracaceae bacterium]
YRQYKNEELAFVSEAADREMYHYANDLLSQSGYDHYEISNSALPGKACRHNRKYWSMEEYLGIGMGASSYVGEKRWKNVEGWEEYLSLVESEAWPMDLDSYHSDTPKDSMAIFCFTALRTKKGIDLEAFKQRYGQEFSSAYGEKMDLLVDYKKNGDLIIDGNQIALTAKGIDRSNEIMSELV